MKADYTPIVTADPKEALRLVEEEMPHLVVLDLVLPGTDGMGLMRDIAMRRDVPVIFLSAHGQEQLVARALDEGATDYLVKPFSPVELAARIRAALRRRETPEPSAPYVLGDLTIDYSERRASVAGQTVPLTAIEYRTLAELASHAGRVLTYEHLLRRVWRLDPDIDTDLRPMRTAISSLRRKLGATPTTPPTSSPNSASATACRKERRQNSRSRRPSAGLRSRTSRVELPRSFSVHQSGSNPVGRSRSPTCQPTT